MVRQFSERENPKFMAEEIDPLLSELKFAFSFMNYVVYRNPPLFQSSKLFYFRVDTRCRKSPITTLNRQLWTWLWAVMATKVNSKKVTNVSNWTLQLYKQSTAEGIGTNCSGAWSQGPPGSVCRPLEAGGSSTTVGLVLSCLFSI